MARKSPMFAFFALAFVATLGTPPVSAQNAGDEAPELSEWVKSVATVSGSFPRKVVFVTKLPAAAGELPEIMDVDPDVFNKLGYIHVADSRSLSWDLKLNAEKLKKSDPLQVVFNLTGADAVVVADGNSWKILNAKSGAKRAVLATGKKARSTKPADLMDWFLVTLGWDGVVLAQKGEYLLVGSTAKILGVPDIQALAIDDSSGKYSIKSGEKKGSGLLGLSGSNEGFAIFDIVFLGQGVKTLDPGTKLIIEKKKK